jgi:hypothetical protein
MLTFWKQRPQSFCEASCDLAPPVAIRKYCNLGAPRSKFVYPCNVAWTDECGGIALYDANKPCVRMPVHTFLPIVQWWLHWHPCHEYCTSHPRANRLKSLLLAVGTHGRQPRLPQQRPRFEFAHLVVSLSTPDTSDKSWPRRHTSPTCATRWSWSNLKEAR